MMQSADSLMAHDATGGLRPPLYRDFGISGAVLSRRFERYPLVPGTFLILHGIAETFGLDAELA